MKTKKIHRRLVLIVLVLIVAVVGELDPHDPIVSPLYGNMQGLPPVDLFTGTWEVFYTDIAKTYNKMKAGGVDVSLHVKEKMGHVYPLWPCPEGEEARKMIAEIISKVKF